MKAHRFRMRSSRQRAYLSERRAYLATRSAQVRRQSLELWRRALVSELGGGEWLSIEREARQAEQDCARLDGARDILRQELCSARRCLFGTSLRGVRRRS